MGASRHNGESCGFNGPVIFDGTAGRDNHVHDACLTPREGDIKYANSIEWAFDGNNWWPTRKEVTGTPSPAECPSSTYDKARLLDAAKETVSGRGKNYGTPEDNFMRIANHWEMFLVNSKGCDAVKFSITPGDVAIMMALMKIARLENDPKHADSWIDLAGYAACGAEIETA